MRCRDCVINEFEKSRCMMTAEKLQEKESLQNFKISTIKKMLTRLKKEKVLSIGFRTRGKQTDEVGLDGKKHFVKGKCYYKLITSDEEF